MDSLYETLYDLSAWIIPLVISITMHEAAHGWVANKLGDDTALRAGRVTFNPLKHIDKFGTIILPGILLLTYALSSKGLIFGYAKPVPVDFSALRRFRRDSALVAFAGPGVNFLLAYLCALLLNLDRVVRVEEAQWFYLNIYRGLQINTVLALFNLLPILPLDGGRIVNAALPTSWQHWYGKVERWGISILLFIMLLPFALKMDYSIIGALLEKPVDFVMNWTLRLAGLGTGYR